MLVGTGSPAEWIGRQRTSQNVGYDKLTLANVDELSGLGHTYTAGGRSCGGDSSMYDKRLLNHVWRRILAARFGLAAAAARPNMERR
jgi:hypothetical protein